MLLCIEDYWSCRVTIIALLITYLSGQSFEVAIIISLVSLATVFQASSTVTIYFQSLVKSKIISISQVTSLVISSAFKVYLVFEQADLIWFGFALLLDSVVTALLLLISYLMRAGNPFLWVFDKSLAKTVLGESWPLIISSAVIAVYTRIDQVMLKSMLDESAVGIYSVAVRISESTVIVPGVVVASFFPAVVAAKKKTKEEYDKAVLLFFSLIVYSGMILSLIVVALSPLFINVFFGSEYSESVSVLRVHMWSMVFSFLGSACTQWLVVEGLTKYRLVRVLIGVFVNISLNIVLIPSYGVLGAAYATLISQMFASYFGNLFSKKTWPVFKLQTKSMLLYFK